MSLGNLPAAVVGMLQAQGLTITTAESFTGGQLAAVFRQLLADDPALRVDVPGVVRRLRVLGDRRQHGRALVVGKRKPEEAFRREVRTERRCACLIRPPALLFERDDA